MHYEITYLWSRGNYFVILSLNLRKIIVLIYCYHIQTQFFNLFYISNLMSKFFYLIFIFKIRMNSLCFLNGLKGFLIIFNPLSFIMFFFSAFLSIIFMGKICFFLEFWCQAVTINAIKLLILTKYLGKFILVFIFYINIWVPCIFNQCLFIVLFIYPCIS